MNHNTDGFYGVNEALLSSALAAVVFSLLSVQPITVVGITGLISLFNYTIFHIIQMHDVSIYPQFMVWVSRRSPPPSPDIRHTYTDSRKLSL